MLTRLCASRAPAVYDLADVMNLTTAGAPGLFLHAVEGTRAAEVDDAPACNCRALVPKWMVRTHGRISVSVPTNAV